MTVWYKQGVVGDLKTVALKALRKVHDICVKHGNPDLFITSVRDGNHSAGSLHYNGNAFDFRPPAKATGVVISEIRVTLGRSFDVVDEGNHIHVEYDPK